jgi:hypothetical protein
VLDRIALTIMAVNRLGWATLRAVYLGLPVRVAAPDRATAEIFRAALSMDAVFLQLTNALVSPLPMPVLGIGGAEVARVWTQFRHVQIWCYRRTLASRGAR